MSYSIRLLREAEKALDRIDQRIGTRIRSRLRELGENPFDPRISKPLTGLDLRSSRVGDWRILYAVNELEQALYVVAIRPRGGAYRHLQ